MPKEEVFRHRRGVFVAVLKTPSVNLEYDFTVMSTTVSLSFVTIIIRLTGIFPNVSSTFLSLHHRSLYLSHQQPALLYRVPCGTSTRSVFRVYGIFTVASLSLTRARDSAAYLLYFSSSSSSSSGIPPYRIAVSPFSHHPLSHIFIQISCPSSTPFVGSRSSIFHVPML